MPKAKEKNARPKQKKKEHYGKAWKQEYRKVNGKMQPVLVKKVKGEEVIKVPSKQYISRHHPQGSWDS